MCELMISFLGVVVVALLVLLLIRSAFLCVRSTSAESIGKEGEYEVAGELNRLPSDEYFVLNDLMVTDARGITTQIDHVVISRFGLFVIETKCYKGWIFANPKNRFWTQSLYAGGRGWFARSEKHRFQNPIKQNWRHIYVLSERLKLPRRYFVNVVVDGLFAKDVFSRFQRFDGKRGMGVRAGTDEDGFDILVLEDLFIIGVKILYAETFRPVDGLLFQKRIGDRLDGGAFYITHYAFAMDFSDTSRADDSYVHHN